MNKKPIKLTGSLFPKQDFETEDDDSWQVSYLDIITIVLGFLIILLSVSQITKSEFTSLSSFFGRLADETEYITTPINIIQEDLYQLLENEINTGQLEIIRDLNDLKIRFSSDKLYASGEASLQAGSEQLLNKVLIALQMLEYNDYQIDIEGHTDNTPISSDVYPSNWELSTARASNVVRYFNDSGVSAKRLKASGYADSRPVIEYDSLGFPYAASKDKNRRVVLRIYYDAENLRQDLAASDTDSSSSQSSPLLTSADVSNKSGNTSPPPSTNTDITIISNQPALVTLAQQNEIEQARQMAEEQRRSQQQEEERQQQIDRELKLQAERELEAQREADQTQATNPNLDEELSRQTATTGVATVPNLLKVDLRCVYAVQLEEFDDLSNGFQKLANLENRVNQLLNILYNNNLFSVRTQPTTSFDNSIALQKQLSATLQNDEIGVLHQCYNNTVRRPKPLKYQIQFGAFQNQNNGMNYTLKLLDEYGIQAYMNRSGDSYQVLTGPYNRPEEVMAEMQRLRDIGVQAGFFIRHQPESVYDYKYAYQIRINAYSSIEQAQLLASQITNDLGVNARVVELTPGEFSVMTGQSSNWNQTRSIFNRIRNSPFETKAIIFTLEYI